MSWDFTGLQERPQSCQTALQKICCEQLVNTGDTGRCQNTLQRHPTDHCNKYQLCSVCLCDNTIIPVQGKKHSFSQCMNGEPSHTLALGTSKKQISAFRFPGMRGDWKRELGAFSFSPSLSVSLESSWNLPSLRSCPCQVPGICHPQDSVRSQEKKKFIPV